ncbi:MAG TPA: SAM-dependent methyltransferase [Ktedonobacterales bacterium]
MPGPSEPPAPVEPYAFSTSPEPAALEALLRAEIRQAGPLSFARFMELALYHPHLGYYAGGGAGREPVGWAGDFVTSGDLSPLWGWAIARQLQQMWELLGRPTSFEVVEPGAGRGLLAASVWRYALALDPAWAAALRYTLLDRAPAGSALRAARERRLAAELAAIPVPEGGVRWLDHLAAATEGGARAITGCIVSNELVDALPVHVVEVRGGQLYEVYVTLADDTANSGRAGRAGAGPGAALVEALGPPSSARVAAYLDRYGVPWRGYPEGWRAEVGLAAEDWIEAVAAALGRGFVLTIDYGATARRLYTRARRRGTLLGYARHRVSAQPLTAPGAQDLTAHVNFSALARAGRAQGLRVAGLTTQAALLEALGVRAEVEALSARYFPHADSARSTDRGQAEYLRRASLRAAVASLLDPQGLGGFHVLVQRRGVRGPGRALLGLASASGVRV